MSIEEKLLQEYNERDISSGKIYNNLPLVF